MNKRIFTIIMLIFFTGFVFAESEGEKAFKENRPEEAISLLEGEISSGAASPSAYNFLGLAYYQTEDFYKSVASFSKGLKTPGTNKKILAFNQGNSYFAMKNYQEAAKSYTLAYSADSNFTKALLNRANAYLMADSLESALSDYENYITVEPEDSQKSEIIEIIDALKKEILKRQEDAKIAELEAQQMAEEEARLEEEMRKMKEEEDRKAKEEKERLEAEEAEKRKIEEQKKAEEAERRRKLLEEVANSLQNTDSTNMSAGTDELIDYDTEGELD